jgi:hypothetical protein
MHRAAASLGFLGNPAGIKRAEAVRLRPSSKQHYCSSHPPDAQPTPRLISLSSHKLDFTLRTTEQDPPSDGSGDIANGSAE